jgi:hypothetical protein
MRAGTEYLHRLKERHTFRRREEADHHWRCCEHWQRTLIYKWNAREFAQRHGCRVPTLYWFGRNVSRLPFESLPEHFVVKPNLGFSRSNVYVMANGTDLLRQAAVTSQQLAAALRCVTRGVLGVPVLVEEFVKTEAGEYQLPIEYKFHVFGKEVGAIEVIRRFDTSRAKARHYTARWRSFDQRMAFDLPLDEYIEPPRCLDQMVESAIALGKACKTYVRADFYASENGCVFGELSSTPARGEGLTPYGDRYFEALWQDAFGASV